MADSILLRCPRCGLHKLGLEFAKPKQGNYCRDCDAEYKRAHYILNRDKYIEKAKSWREANPGRKNALDKAWHAENKERVARNSREWAARNPEKRRASYAKYRREKLDRARSNEQAYRDRNRDACNLRIREWKRENKHAVVAHAGKRRAAELNAVPLWADFSAIANIYRQAKVRGLSVDHIVPLISRVVCGLHCEANMQLLTVRENSKKSNRHWPDMWE